MLTNWTRYRTIRPVSRVFGLDRGEAIDRYYIEMFLSDNQEYIHGVVLEVANSYYTKKFGGSRVVQPLVLHATSHAKADLVGNLETGSGIPENLADCFILTQTLLCIFDVRAAAGNAVKVLKPGGTLLVTVPGITSISRYDYERWGQYWSFTDQSLRKLFELFVPPERITIQTFGNVKSASAFLYGLARHEIKPAELEYADPDFQMVITAVIRKPEI